MTDSQALKIDAALALYTARQERQDHPAGTFDSAGRWYPDAEEYRACCQDVRSPTRAYPYSYILHCRTLKHVARLLDVPEAELRAANARNRARGIKPRREGGDQYYKAVAIASGPRLLSIYDGETEYRQGVTVSDPARQGHEGGIYVYGSQDAAADAEVPSYSALYDAPRAILRVRAEGAYCRYDSGKLAFSRVTPLEIASFQQRGLAQVEWAEVKRAVLSAWENAAQVVPSNG
jgi:hypothetical protein